MGFDALVLSALVNELRTELSGARVQRVYQPAKDEVVLAMAVGGRERFLVLSLHPTLFHVRLSDSLESANTPPGQLGLLLRRHLDGLRFRSIDQTPFEREFSLVFEGSEHEFPRPRFNLVARLIPRAVDLTLTDGSGRLLGALATDRAPVSGSAVTLPGQALPDQVTLEFFTQAVLFAPEEARLADLLVKHFRGISPPVARELVFRAGLPISAARSALVNVDPLWQAFKGLLSDIAVQRWSPSIASGAPLKGEELTVVRLSHAPSSRAFLTTNAAISAYFADRARRERLAQIRSTLLHNLRTLHGRAARKAAAQEEELHQADRASALRHQGDLLLANLSALRQGAREARVLDYATGEEAVIALDPALTPAENAQLYFKRYQKAKRGRVATQEQLARTRKEEEYLAQVLLTLEQAESPDEVEQIREEMAEEGYLRRYSRSTVNKGKGPGFSPRRYLTTDGLEVLVGRNNKENDRLTLKTGAPDDWWFHAKDIPGAHVILRGSESGEPPETSLREAAAIAAYNSRSRGDAKVQVDYTRRRHVWKPSGGKPGMVLYDHQRSVVVAPGLPVEREVDSSRSDERRPKTR